LVLTESADVLLNAMSDGKGEMMKLFASTEAEWSESRPPRKGFSIIADAAKNNTSSQLARVTTPAT
jgi:hypothetical protein